MNIIDRVLRSNLKLKHLQLLVALDPLRHLGRTAEFLGIFNAVIDHKGVGFVAHEVGKFFENKGLFKILPIELAMDLPPVGLITLRAQRISQSTLKLMDCLRSVAKSKH